MSRSLTAGRQALSYVLARSLVNRALRILSGLRKPRYFIAAVIGLIYFGALALLMMFTEPTGVFSDPGLIQAIARPVLAIIVIWWWIGGKSHTVLGFSPAEVQLLFQAPVPRSVLVRYKLVRAQLGVAISALVVAIFGARYFPVSFLQTFISVWILMATLHLHQVAAALTRTNWSQRRASGRRGSRLAAVLFVAWAGTVLFGLSGALQVVRGSFSFSAAWLGVQASLAHPATVAALFPIDVVLAPLFASDLWTWVWTCTGGGAILVLQYLWVVQVDEAFEEGAATAGQKASAKIAAAKEGRLDQLATTKRLTPPWFQLDPRGRPAMAIFWKNFLSFTRSLRPIFILVLGFLFVGAYLIVRIDLPDQAALIMASVAGAIAVLWILFGPFTQRNDLRSDLLKLDVVRPYPLSGRHLVTAEIAAAAASLAVTQAVLLFLGLVFLLIASPELPWSGIPVVAYIAAVITLPFLNAIGIVIQNLLAVTFPGWYRMGPDSGQGIDAIGGLLVLTLITLIGLLLAYVVPVGLGIGLTLVAWPLVGWVAVGPGLIVAWALMGGEIVALVGFVGRLYDNLDPVDSGLLR